MHQALPFDLSQLQNQCVLRSDVRADSHDLVARELTDHKLQWQRGAVSMSLSKTKLRKLGLYVLEYGPEVEIAPRPYGDFVVVHVTLEGRAEVASDGQFLALPEGRTAVIHARRNLRLRWQEGSRHLLIKVPHTLLEQGLSESPQAAWSSMSPAWLFPQEADAQWNLLVQSLLQSSSSIASLPAGESWLDHFERSVALFLWEQAKAAGSVTCTTATPDVVEPEGSLRYATSVDLDRFEAMEAYMHRKLAAPVSLEDLAIAVGVSPRTLSTLCQRFSQVSPMQRLRDLRLDAARTQLIERRTTITRAAVEFGFMHLGRFSSLYKRRFGELPSETLQGASRQQRQ